MHIAPEVCSAHLKNTARMISAPASHSRRRGLDISWMVHHVSLPTAAADVRPGIGFDNSRSTCSAIWRDRSHLYESTAATTRNTSRQQWSQSNRKGRPSFTDQH